MIKKVEKRDGRLVRFSLSKIEQSIISAMEDTDNIDEALAYKIAKEISSFDNLTVDEIQDLIEKKLMASSRKDVAKNYILYRADRSRVREMNTYLMKTYEDLTFKDAKDNDTKRENANIDSDTSMGTMLKYGSEGAKRFNLLYLLKPEHAKAHVDGDIHIHDLDFYALTTTCCQIDISKLFKDGFSTGHGFLRTPNSIGSYAALAAIAIQANQNDQHGGQSIPALDTFLAPGVKKTYIKKYYSNLRKALEFISHDIECSSNDVINKIKLTLSNEDIYPSLDDDENYNTKEKQIIADYGYHLDDVELCQEFARRNAIEETDKETYQAMEAFIHNLNTMHSRAGAQVPFSSVTFGDDPTSEARMVTKNFLLATDAGLGNGETAIFPVSIFRVKEGVNYNPADPNYDLFKLAMKVSAKRLFPNFCFADATFNAPGYDVNNYDTKVAYMGCRTRVKSNVYDPTREVTCGRGNLSFTSINLPRLAIESNHNIKAFYKSLDKTMDLVFDQLYERLLVQGRRKVYNHPFLMGQGIWLDSDNLSPDDELAEVLKHGTLTTGFIGLAETLKALIGEHHGESEEARKLGLEIISHMRERCDAKSKETNLNYSLIATPELMRVA